MKQWDRITLSRTTTIYFIFSVLHCILQIIFQGQAYRINVDAANFLASITKQGGTVDSDAFYVLGSDLRLCDNLPTDFSTSSCQVVWNGTTVGDNSMVATNIMNSNSTTTSQSIGSSSSMASTYLLSSGLSSSMHSTRLVSSGSTVPTSSTSSDYITTSGLSTSASPTTTAVSSSKATMNNSISSTQTTTSSAEASTYVDVKRSETVVEMVSSHFKIKTQLNAPSIAKQTQRSWEYPSRGG